VRLEFAASAFIVFERLFEPTGLIIMPICVAFLKKGIGILG